MTLEMKLMEEREAGRTEGLVQGRTEGLAQGRTEGLAQGHQEAVFLCVQDGDISVSRGAEKLGLSEKDFCEAMKQAGFN